MNQAGPPRRPLSAGSEIDAWCTRCRMDLGHRIVAMVQSTPKRVVCMTCGSEHNYRAPKSAELAKEGAKRRRVATGTKSTSSGSKTRAAAKTLAREEWEKRIRSGKPFRRYGINETFSENDLVTHKKFGDGYVSSVNDGKVTVVFSDGERTLVHGVPE